MIYFISGLLILFFSTTIMYRFYCQNEWRVPLFCLDGELNHIMKQEWPGVRRRAIIIPFFLLALFFVGSFLVLNSSVLQKYTNLFWVFLGIILFWFLSAVYKLILASYSLKTRLLNYLYSPYLFVWRRDFWSKYSDQEIAQAICRACGIEDESLLRNNKSLEDFLILLCCKERPERECEIYPKILKKIIIQSNQIRRRY